LFLNKEIKFASPSLLLVLPFSAVFYLVFCRYPPSEQALILFNSGISTLFVALGLKFNSSTCVVVARLLRKNKQQTS
jgi:hypothetical protein